MYKILSIYVVTFLFIFSTINAGATTVDLTPLMKQDPWLTFYDRFQVDHSECSPIAGNLLIQPDYTRLLSFYDDTQKEPMILGSAIGDSASFVLQNSLCKIQISISRSISSEPEQKTDPFEMSRDANMPRFQNPAMVGEIRYNSQNLSCTRFTISFYADRNNFSLTQASSFIFGYKISSLSLNHGESVETKFEKDGCSERIVVSLKIKTKGEWVSAYFRP